ncbi:hypothetical protein FRB94_001222 [Tulasnella sp. JGI-2019a]|nr:hypothetical protein FRB94_001222 [Tulasnella sp. JGI-2019a]KAG9028128.1 hypothetical protein FRB95_006812 [Tulasnella sp. JGI-2019a]
MHAPSLVIMALCASPALAAPFKLPKLPFFSSEMMTHQLDLEAARIVAEVETNAMRPAEYAILKDASRAKIIAGDGHGQSTQKLAKERIAKIKKELEAAIKAPKGEDHPAPLDAAIAKEKLRTFKEAAGETDWGKVAGYGAVAAGAGILGAAISHSKSPDPVSVQSTDPTATGVADVTETNTPTPTPGTNTQNVESTDSTVTGVTDVTDSNTPTLDTSAQTTAAPSVVSKRSLFLRDLD